MKASVSLRSVELTVALLLAGLLAEAASFTDPPQARPSGDPTPAATAAPATMKEAPGLATGPRLAVEGTLGPIVFPGEAHLRNVRQLTFGGENAEAYWSADASHLIFQAHDGEVACDQIYTMTAAGEGVRQVSTGGGRTTCAYFFPDGERLVYASTRHLGEDCPQEPDMSRGYVWGLYDYDVYAPRPDGSAVIRLKGL